jgi:serine/threonine protein kinase
MPPQLYDILHKSELSKTWYIVQFDGGQRFHWGESDKDVDSIKADVVNKRSIPFRWHFAWNLVYPRYDPAIMTLCKNADAPDVYVKKQRLLQSLHILKQPGHYKKLALREINICQLISGTPHPNICAYKGVVLDSTGKMVVGIAYHKYKYDLHQLRTKYTEDCLQASSDLSAVSAASGAILDTEHIIACVKAGAEHLHKLGLVHGDIRPSNIFVSPISFGSPFPQKLEVALGDFNSVHRIGQKLDLKKGARGCMPDDVEFGDAVATWMDEYALTQLRATLDIYERTLQQTRTITMAKVAASNNTRRLQTGKWGLE